jgi:hypothetical protein
MALAVAVFLAPMASSAPDGLEWVGGKLGLIDDDSPVVVRGLVPDYAMPGIRHVRLATAAAGVTGTLVVFLFSVGLARALRAQAANPVELGAAGPERVAVPR